MHAWYTMFLELHRLPKGHSPLLLQLQDAPSGPPLFLFNSSCNLLLWLFKILCIFFTVFLLKISLNGLSLLMYLI